MSQREKSLMLISVKLIQININYLKFTLQFWNNFEFFGNKDSYTNFIILNLIS